MQKLEAATIRAVPGVKSVARVNSFPVSRSGSNSGMAADRNCWRHWRGDLLVSRFARRNPGLRLVEGSDFRPSDFIEVDAASSQESP